MNDKSDDLFSCASGNKEDKERESGEIQWKEKYGNAKKNKENNNKWWQVERQIQLGGSNYMSSLLVT